jgi:hypothetical protein
MPTGPGAKRGRASALPLIVLLAVLILIPGLGRPVRVTAGSRSETLWLWAWQKGRVNFINSVTGRPVEIRFYLPWYFSGFTVRTDPGTEEYYTGGEYRWQSRLDEEYGKRLVYCSEVGLVLTLGGHTFRAGGGCVQASLLWPL